MAKKENQESLTAGLSFTLPEENKETVRSVPAKTAQAEVKAEAEQNTLGQRLVAEYAAQIKEAEPRKERLSIVVTKTTKKEIDELVKQKKIKSANDLVNRLVEEFLKGLKVGEGSDE